MMLSGFNWIIDQRLAGSGKPGLLADIDEDLDFIRESGIRTLVTLTETPVEALAEVGEDLEVIHFPIPDMGFPTPRSCADLCSRVNGLLESQAVLLHCRAGLGRTGTIAACCLVSQGEAPGEALRRVRVINPRYVQTNSQERFIHHFAAFLKEK